MKSTIHLLPVIEQALKGLRYGHVQLVVHEGELVRIERVEKIRCELEKPTGPSGGPTNLRDIPTCA